MLVKISKEHAKKLFGAYRKFVAVACNLDPENESTNRFEFQKTFFTKEFPAKRLTEFAGIVCSESHGQALALYIETVDVLISWSSNGSIIRNATSKEVIKVIHGKENSLIDFVNRNYLNVKNSGYLMPQYAAKIKLKM